MKQDKHKRKLTSYKLSELHASCNSWFKYGKVSWMLCINGQESASFWSSQCMWSVDFSSKHHFFSVLYWTTLSADYPGLYLALLVFRRLTWCISFYGKHMTSFSSLQFFGEGIFVCFFLAWCIPCCGSVNNPKDNTTSYTQYIPMY